MSNSRLLGLADSLVAAFNAAPSGAFVVPFAAMRKLLPLIDLKAPGLQVYVIGISNSEESQGGLTSGVFKGEYEVDLVVQQKFCQTDDVEAEGDTLINLAEQLRDFCKTQKFAAGDATATLVDVDARPAYNMKALLTDQHFVSVQTLTFCVL